MRPTRDTNTAARRGQEGIVEAGRERDSKQWLNGIMHKCQAIYSAPSQATRSAQRRAHPHYDRQCQHEILNHFSICTWVNECFDMSLCSPSPHLWLWQRQPSSLNESPTNDDEVIEGGVGSRRGRLGFSIWHNELSEISCAFACLHHGWLRSNSAWNINEYVID